MTDLEQARLYERLRRTPSTSSVPGTLPVLFFGDLFRADVASVGLNPSHREFLTKDGALLAGSAQRFATTGSLGSDSRSLLSDGHCAEAVQRMLNYYQPGNPVHSRWFDALARVIDGFGASFGAGSATHLDLVQESTRPVWSNLDGREREELLKQDLPFLEWEIRAFHLRAVICTGKTVSVQLRRRLRVSLKEEGTMERIKWWVGHADLDGRRVGFGGWNIPLARATGLGREGETALGKLLAQKLGL